MSIPPRPMASTLPSSSRILLAARFMSPSVPMRSRSTFLPNSSIVCLVSLLVEPMETLTTCRSCCAFNSVAFLFEAFEYLAADSASKSLEQSPGFHEFNHVEHVLAEAVTVVLQQVVVEGSVETWSFPAAALQRVMQEAVAPLKFQAHQGGDAFPHVLRKFVPQLLQFIPSMPVKGIQDRLADFLGVDHLGLAGLTGLQGLAGHAGGEEVTDETTQVGEWVARVSAAGF